MATASPLPVTAGFGARKRCGSRKAPKSPGKIGSAIFIGVLCIGFVYAGYHLISDLSVVHSPSIFPYILLGLALLVALGFEFVNGFHDTANAVATVIYTHSLDPPHCGSVVRDVEFHRRSAVHRSGGLRHHLVAAGGVDPAGG